MSLPSIQSPRSADLLSGSRPVRGASAIDVTISDGGVARQGMSAAVEPRSLAEAETTRGLETRHLEAGAERALAPPAAASRRSQAAVALAAAIQARSGAAAELPDPTAPAAARDLGVYTGRGRTAREPRSGAAGQLIDVTG
ncbi:MAG: hypothetical protein ABIL09_14665 [Gemmatimonadota bacterium]